MLRNAAVGAAPDDTAAFSITVSNVNQPPVLNPSAFAIDENSPNGTLVGVVTGTDPDVGQSLAYSIVGGAGSSAFAIDPATGEITVANSGMLDYEIRTSFALDVRVADNGSPSLSDTATVTINIGPLDKRPLRLATHTLWLKAMC